MKRVLISATALATVLFVASSIATTQAPMSTDAKMDRLDKETKKLEREVRKLKKEKKEKHQVTYLNAHQTGSTTAPWPHFVTVTTTPFLGKKMLYDGADLLFNMSSMNEDMHLLQQKQKIVDNLAAQGYTLDRPVLQVSGGVEGQLFSVSGFGTNPNDGVNLSTAELDFNAIASAWATGFMSLAYNGTPVSLGNRAPNSQIYLSRGFFTLGNLDKSPFYFSMGMMYVPYGRYANDMVSTPLTVSMGKIRSQAALLGVSLNNGLFGSVYGFSGYQTSGGSPVFKQGGVNVGLKRHFSAIAGRSYSVGAGWVSNVADAEGQQATGLSTATGQFGGFGVSQPNTSAIFNNIAHRVGGGDVYGNVTCGAWTVIGEYLGAIEKYSTTDLVYNGKGAEPRALHTEIDYVLPWFAQKYDTTLGVSYGHAWEALALNLPESSYATFLSTSLLPETTESIEYRHDSDYSRADVATGRGAVTNIVGTGKGRNSVILQLGVYF
ncbi:MAG: hypothetical protein A3I77_02420 [Gammaproteobacteria bacterium RIFCSPLOWO2_02_FULL_42_14]|nr:MAG: hypothetical protein A3B71_02260 [Gammaproteobacteria bacterium RIFCSPHIGHO2_02_FULL_42_43]OGT29012.1 MAG: hypothetical protein A2624_00210 [Gammaproteobacteria bacterium RIFCSPHIGHO2_01_FULL_42_8]OGT53508.1 MAG: hypothetical protein A3E54_02285 [Gammaproteobacteria bacterium RIFCSPHIGHO2_12_FULL_41_25]OGT61454.1 MAG: hypothetical protein A3I77_02420 [Gammaproteobacteria bacterium RIFCSPLOWO2_02_FULL_42_14]OGT86482.1 MAG: hypothetical protein A3G86_02495 [Gammaproteobacteria bacterium R